MNIIEKIHSEEAGSRCGRQRWRASGIALVLACSSALVLSGCTGTRGFGGSSDPLPARQTTPQPLQPAPLTPVQEGTLQPATPSGQPVPPAEGAVPADPAGIPAEPKPAETQVAVVDESAAPPVTREALIGAWTVSTGGSSCQLFLALTKWSGGYRAAPRGCGSTGIRDVAAWDVKGKQVVLVGSSGDTVATLYKGSGESYSGSVNGGGAISFSR